MKAYIAVCAFLLFPATTTAHDVSVDGAGGVKIKCDNGTAATGRLNGTTIMFDVTYPDGSRGGASVMPSGGSTDPSVAIGDGTSLTQEICGS